MQTEIWKDAVGYEGLYQVSNMGRVKSMARLSIQGHQIYERILKPGKVKHGYPKYGLCKGGKVYYKNLHRLIAEAFIPNPTNLPCINHIDNNPGNNTIENLEWCTFSHNTRHAYKSQRLVKVGELNSMAKLTADQALYIFKSNEPKIALERMFNISRQTINDIKAGRRWCQVTGKRHPSVKIRLCEAA